MAPTPRPALVPTAALALTGLVLAAFAAALDPAAIAAQSDVREDLYDFFALIAELNADPDSMTNEQTNEAFAQLAALGPHVLSDCGVDLML